MTEQILVTGGAGYIGSHFVKLLQHQQPDVEIVIVDNLVNGHREALKNCKLYEFDFGDKKQLNKLFQEYNFSTVIHFAAFAQVGESVENPSKYYHNNVVNTINLLDCMIENGIKDFVFSSTCATYGEPEYTPIDELHPQKPINPYGKSKLMIEQILEDYSNAYDLNFVVFRYFNACGCDFDGEIGDSHKEISHVIPIILKAIKGERENITIFGTDYETDDGTCIRDYIHVDDLANAHIKAISYLENGGQSTYINLGSGKGFSVKEVIKSCERVSGKAAPTKEGKRRTGDPAVLYAEAKLAKEALGWEAKHTDIDKIIETAWKWENNKKF